MSWTKIRPIMPFFCFVKVHSRKESFKAKTFPYTGCDILHGYFLKGSQINRIFFYWLVIIAQVTVRYWKYNNSIHFELIPYAKNCISVPVLKFHKPNTVCGSHYFWWQSSDNSTRWHDLLIRSTSIHIFCTAFITEMLELHQHPDWR
jgi:hypothetical protein